MTSPLLFVRTLGILRGDSLDNLVRELADYFLAFKASAKA